ncbi:MAG: GntR family transcriptional regulator [Lentisphaerae bacterium]|nr:GntR family transcriptional regulator [Lentisphaerota bacterium]
MTEYPKYETIPEKIFRLIVAKIQSGELCAGDRLPGDRQLAGEYEVGRSSMIAALQLLQQKGYIDRIPMRGSFVRTNVEKITGEVRIFVPLPEAVMLPELIGFANFIAENEMQQGMVAEANLRNFSTTFRHMEDSSDPLVLRRQLEIISESADAVAFIGPQFIHLREQIMQQRIPAVIVEPNQIFHSEEIPSISYNRETAFAMLTERVRQDTPHTFEFIYLDNPTISARLDLEYRMKIFEKHLIARNIEVKYHVLPNVDRVSPELVSGLEEILTGRVLPDAVCCPHFPVVMAVQEIALRKNLGLGEKFRVFGFTGGGIFSLAYPSVPYLRVPCFELGRIASEMLCEHVVSGKKLQSRVINGTIYDGGK